MSQSITSTIRRNASEQLEGCEYCGLPVRSSRAGDDRDRYCCLGCELADRVMSDNAEADTMVGRTAMRLGLAIFFSMNVMVFTMVLWSWDAYAVSAGKNATIFKELLRLACLMFATPVVLILGKPLIASVVSQMRRRIMTTDVLLIAGVAAAYGFSLASIASGGEHIYFEVACMILLAVTLGRWLEATGKQRAMKSLESLQNLLPNMARKVTGNQTALVPLGQIRADETIRVLPGERIPLDGTVVSGASFTDQRMVTGESAAQEVTSGAEVFGGTANLDGRIDVRVTAPASDGVIQRLIETVRDAARRTSRPERMADRLATVFAPLVCLVGIVVFVVHYRNDGLQAGMMASMSVALIACPCALAIATPLAMWAALSKASERGIVFRSGDDLIALSEIDHVCLDKTGTITTGVASLVDATYEDQSPFCVDVATALASQTQHPLASAILNHFTDDMADNTALLVQSARTIPGKGVLGEIVIDFDRSRSGNSIGAVFGSAAYCEEGAFEFPYSISEAREQADAQHLSTVFVGWDGSVRACFSFDETLRSEASAAIAALKSQRLKTIMLTGDQPSRAARIGAKLGLSMRSKMLPSDKQDVIASLQERGHKVAMVGDGLNDAPSLSLASVGVALGCGVEVSRDAANVCLMSSNLLLLPWAIDLARRTRRTISRNLFWALAYNTIGIALAATGRLNPIFAAVAMVLSSILVTAESLRLTGNQEILDVDELATPPPFPTAEQTAEVCKT